MKCSMLNTIAIDSILLHKVDKTQVASCSLRKCLGNIDYVLLEQIHSSNVVCINSHNEARSLMRSDEDGKILLSQGDGLISTVPGLYVFVQTADCVPVLLANKRGEFVCALHCGWRGVYDGIIGNAYSLLKDFHETIAWIGPSIKQASYAVDSAYRENFLALDSEYDKFFAYNNVNRKYYFDLPGIVEHQLRLYGVDDISVSQEDTYTSNIYPSYRRCSEENKECAERIICGVGIISH
ncbi:Laccase domain protein [Rickettsiales endosymbiont of Paramecium tredecaurelia]|uniref:peptidoglycan editing factor PgeF n=1 Tax=Candidatus Sarmatiella mevalonica TaxID=2770581 RepID=UPI0019212DE3|nr:peptidoglycan editing factor PgeF [Candidatus Sarmatiella mevalonica]MBL3284626.1 Laccase domain protein [Candidatus Sarmatiella mevalonica]